ncbi:MAG: hypothetical protein RL384_643 [Actinomycetota bacterium]
MPQVTDSFGSYRLASPSFFKQLVSGFAVTASLVCDEQGRTVSPLGSSKGLGNATDLELLIALRRQANVILTSGATFRADEYRFPRSADLAVLSRQSVDIEVPAGRKLHLIASGFGEAIDELLNRQYGRIHVEYGLAGITEVVAKGLLDALFLSSKSRDGVQRLSKNLGVEPTFIELSDLYIGLVAWQTGRLKS